MNAMIVGHARHERFGLGFWDGSVGREGGSQRHAEVPRLTQDQYDAMNVSHGRHGCHGC
jgi:hypothetical protein